MIEAFKEVILLHRLINDLEIIHEHVRVHYNSQVHHTRTKHRDVRFHFFRKNLNERDILLEKIGIADNPANLLTKVITGIKFQHCLDLINIFSQHGA